MDGHQFDQFARVIASGVSRRRVLGMLSGAIASIGAGFSSRSVLAGCGQDSDVCQSTQECCNGFICLKGLCSQDCGLFGDSCNTTGLDQAGGPVYGCCASGLECIEGICDEPAPICGNEGDSCFDPQVTGSGDQFSCCNDGMECIQGTCQFPEPTCGDEGDYCGPKSNECCNQGLACIDDFCAIPEPVCGDEGQTCSGDLAGFPFECCNDGLLCIDGTCQVPEETCAEVGDPCGNVGVGADGIQCCDDLICVDNVCEVPEEPCTAPGDVCDVDDECCSGICCGGICADIECCVDDADPNDRCAEGTSCFEGICEGVAEICEVDDDCGVGTCCCDDGSCSEDCCDPPAEDEEEPVTQLPNTGIGGETSSRTGWIGAAATGCRGGVLREQTVEAGRAEKSELDRRVTRPNRISSNAWGRICSPPQSIPPGTPRSGQ